MANEADTSLETTALETTNNTSLESSLDTIADPSALETALDAGQTANELGFVEIAVNFMLDGGTFMFIILFFLFFGLAIVIERYIYLSRMKSKNQKTWNGLFPVLSQGKFKQALEVAKTDDSAVSRMVVYGLSRSAYSRRSEDIEAAMDEGLMEVVPRLEARTPYIATLANIVTLLGLLGTIIGLIQAFTAVASADPAEKADLLSASISIAMNTTAFGLIAAIPLLLSFALLQAKTAEIVDSLEMASVKFLNIFRQAQANADQKKDAAS
jgi:biopolymer transport protein ExbB/TolQ